MNDINNAVWPGWEIAGEVGRGSFGAVYEMQKDVFGMIDKAALKIITIPKNRGDIEELFNDGYDEASITEKYKGFLEDIVREYKLMAELKGNPNIVYCDDIRYMQHEDGFGWDIYIKMELLTPLTRAVKSPLDVRQVVEVGMDICNALMACEEKNIIHRDIKPQNIFVSSGGEYKLGDFGIAKTAEHISTGTKTGTFKYMAPEIYNNQPYGSACDIYSLGMVLYWLLNDRRMPFLPLPPQVPTATEENDALIRRMQGEITPAPLHGNEELKRIVLKACNPNPAMRYTSAKEMYRALGNVLHTFSKSEESHVYENTRPYEEEESEETVGIFGSGFANEPKQEEALQDIVSLQEPEKKSSLVALLLALFPLTGIFGVHDFYLQKRKMGLLKLCTMNFASVGWLFDVVAFCIGIYKDKDGNKLTFQNNSQEKVSVSTPVSVKTEERHEENAQEAYEATVGVFGSNCAEEVKEDAEIELAITTGQMTLGCTVEAVVLTTGEKIMVTIPAGKKAGGTFTVPTQKSGNVMVRLKSFTYQKDEHKKNVWGSMSDAKIWAYATGCGMPSKGDWGRRIGSAILVFVLFCTGGAFFPPIGFVGFGVTAWVLIKPSDAKKNREAARAEWKRRYPNITCE